MAELFTKGNQNLDITNASIGVDREGMTSYIQELRINILETIEKDLKDVEDMQAKIDAAWTGKSKDRFLDAFDGSINGVIIDMEAEFQDLCNRIFDMENSFVKMDEALAEDY